MTCNAAATSPFLLPSIHISSSSFSFPFLPLFLFWFFSLLLISLSSERVYQQNPWMDLFLSERTSSSYTNWVSSWSPTVFFSLFFVLSSLSSFLIFVILSDWILNVRPLTAREFFFLFSSVSCVKFAFYSPVILGCSFSMFFFFFFIRVIFWQKSHPPFFFLIFHHIVLVSCFTHSVLRSQKKKGVKYHPHDDNNYYDITPKTLTSGNGSPFGPSFLDTVYLLLQQYVSYVKKMQLTYCCSSFC